jgi:ribosomal 50S subunit-associated protein YjgA (DUF615 family)
VASVKSLNKEMNDKDEKEETRSSMISKSQSRAKEHMKELERLKEKVGGFYSCSRLIIKKKKKLLLKIYFCYLDFYF